MRVLSLGDAGRMLSFITKSERIWGRPSRRKRDCLKNRNRWEGRSIGGCVMMLVRTHGVCRERSGL